jgi:hypothetical protein
LHCDRITLVAGRAGLGQTNLKLIRGAQRAVTYDIVGMDDGQAGNPGAARRAATLDLMGELQRANAGAVARRDLEQFELVLLGQLEAMGLPSDAVLVDVRERGRMLANVAETVESLDEAVLERSFYISKMIAAAAVGLFDASLNYLWDETVGELRRRVAGYDLAYFFDIAVSSPDRRKQLSTVEDLARVDDVDLLRAARDIGLISHVGHAQLDHIRFMRNYASAAHPNQVELTGMQLATWLETCIREVITLPLDTVTAETGKLLANLRARRLDDDEVDATAAFFDQLPDDRADALAAGFFGLYTDPASTPTTKDNVRVLWPELWPFLGDPVRHEFGTKYARFAANADGAQAAAARELLDLVDGQAYLPDPVRAAELDAGLDALLAAHHGFDNFYNEPAPARALNALVGDQGDVPDAVVDKYTRTLVEAFLSNGYGISHAADPIYRSMIERFSAGHAARALRSFTAAPVAAKLNQRLPQRQWETLLDMLEPKLTSRRDRDLLDAIRAYTGSPGNLALDAGIRKLLGTRSGRRARRSSS